ncbi:cell division topological specificity factor MinE [Anoxybacter fermentans]|uniref:cell division topological specificity factor MinE n=1 Tax=Anoxybacter fermentans TaxID=1323375 RepID=UPI001EFFF0B8|nr:cell division topological specificity factor MinE [Anoxybacter fermentans]
MIEFIKKLSPRENSKDIAKERLQFILIHDRIQLSPRELEEMKKDIIAVVSKYVEVEENELEMSLKRREETMALHANIPIRSKRS